jgi:hypothetical protein
MLCLGDCDASRVCENIEHGRDMMHNTNDATTSAMLTQIRTCSTSRRQIMQSNNNFRRATLRCVAQVSLCLVLLLGAKVSVCTYQCSRSLICAAKFALVDVCIGAFACQFRRRTSNFCAFADARQVEKEAHATLEEKKKKDEKKYVQLHAVLDAVRIGYLCQDANVVCCGLQERNKLLL